MMIARPVGAQYHINKNHENGFLPMWVRADLTEHNGGLVESLTTAWEPTPDELVNLNKGGVIEVNILFPNLIPMMLRVTEPVDSIEDSEEQKLFKIARLALENLKAFHSKVLDEQTIRGPEEFPLDMDTYQHAQEQHGHVMRSLDHLRKMSP